MAERQDNSEGKTPQQVIKTARQAPAQVCKALWKLGRDDPRRVIHAMKVGVALTLVSFLYVLEPLFGGIGQNAMWAVMTVVVVLEFTAGATLGKGLNRGLGTLCAGSLAFIIEIVAEKSGKELRAVFIGSSVFIIGFSATFIRFIPYIKKNYDYGVVVFLLTFNLITVSSYRVSNVLHLAQNRFYTIAIGCGICLVMSLLILPCWSGEELHRSTARKLEGLARSVEVCINEYFKDKDIVASEEEEQESKDLIQKGFRTVLDSKSSDENLAHFAGWEPRFSRQCQRYPWHRYLKLGAIMRHFACSVAALHGCLESEIQTPKSGRTLFREPCSRVAKEVSTVLRELSNSIMNRHCISPDLLTNRLHEALQGLNSVIKSQPKLLLGSNSANRRLMEWKRDTGISPRSGLPTPTKEISPRFGLPPTPNREISPRSGLPPTRSDSSTLMGLRSKSTTDKPKHLGDIRQLRPSLSRLALTSLEFCEALPFAAFASMLVEMVARLDLLIQGVEELGNAANFKECSQNDSIAINLSSISKKSNESGREIQDHHVSQVGE